MKCIFCCSKMKLCNDCMLKHLEYHNQDSKEGCMIYTKKERVLKFDTKPDQIKGNKMGFF